MILGLLALGGCYTTAVPVSESPKVLEDIPRGDEWIIIRKGELPLLATAGVIQVDVNPKNASSATTKSERTWSGANVSMLSDAIAERISAVSGATLARYDERVQELVSKHVQLPETTSITNDVAPSLLPQSIDDLLLLSQLRLQGITHLVLARGLTKSTDLDAGMFIAGAAFGAPAIGVRTSRDFVFDLEVAVYQIEDGARSTGWRGQEAVTGYVDWALVPIPVGSVSVDASRFLRAMGGRAGAEIGRRFRVVEAKGMK